MLTMSVCDKSGPDGLYTCQPTAGGNLGFDDLSSIDAVDADYIGQAWHQTINGMYNDTINFAIEPSGDGTVITAFSISQIAGALGDAGQNYLNLIQLFGDADDVSHLDDSCPDPSASALPEPKRNNLRPAKKIKGERSGGLLGVNGHGIYNPKK